MPGMAMPFGSGLSCRRTEPRQARSRPFRASIPIAGAPPASPRAADLVLVPCRPAVHDVETVADTRDLVAAAAPRTRVFCVLNAVPLRGPGRGARELFRGATRKHACATWCGAVHAGVRLRHAVCPLTTAAVTISNRS